MTKLAHLWTLFLSLPAPVLGLVGVLAGSALLKLLPNLPGWTSKGFAWVGKQIAKMKPGYAKDLLTRLSSLVLTHVLAAENLAIEDLKTAMVNGSLSVSALPAALLKVKGDVLANLKDSLNAQGLWHDLLWVAFGGDENALEAHIDTTLEAAVSSLPPSGLQTSALSSAKLPAATHVASALTAPAANVGGLNVARP
jgi:hypothetical protein